MKQKNELPSLSYLEQIGYIKNNRTQFYDLINQQEELREKFEQDEYELLKQIKESAIKVISELINKSNGYDELISEIKNNVIAYINLEEDEDCDLKEILPFEKIVDESDIEELKTAIKDLYRIVKDTEKRYNLE